LFHGVKLIDKTFLDIGGGSGIFSFYAACNGANKVMCLEPEVDGSKTNVTDIFNYIKNQLMLESNIILNKSLIQNYNPSEGKFDVVLMHYSINHLSELNCIKLKNDNNAKAIYKNIFQHIYNISNNGATIIIVDQAKCNIFPLLNLKNPFVPTIEWEKHQSPYLWANIMSEVGFKKKNVSWLSFNRFGKIGKYLTGNIIVSFFLNSTFCLTMEK
jgi:SAM-dependent methyltransferase